MSRRRGRCESVPPPEAVIADSVSLCCIKRSSIPSTFTNLEPPPDTVWDSKPAEQGKPINWVELKTSAEIRDERGMANFERKLMKFWIQSFLLGVPKIIVGFRTQGGILSKLEEIKTVAIPETAARRGVRSWDANTCINFASGFLDCESSFRLCSAVSPCQSLGLCHGKSSRCLQRLRVLSASALWSKETNRYSKRPHC